MIHTECLWKWYNSLGCLESDYEIDTLGPFYFCYPLHTWLVSPTGRLQKVQRTSVHDLFHI